MQSLINSLRMGWNWNQEMISREQQRNIKPHKEGPLMNLLLSTPLVFEKHVAVAKKNVKNFSPFPYYWMFYRGCSENLLGEIKWEVDTNIVTQNEKIYWKLFITLGSNYHFNV